MHTDDVAEKLAEGEELEDEWPPLTVSVKASRIPESMFPLEERIAILVDAIKPAPRRGG
ncbi:MAG: hypothetical protein ACXV3D_02370 [Halobacteriota archaeon]